MFSRCIHGAVKKRSRTSYDAWVLRCTLTDIFTLQCTEISGAQARRRAARRRVFSEDAFERARCSPSARAARRGSIGPTHARA